MRVEDEGGRRLLMRVRARMLSSEAILTIVLSSSMSFRRKVNKMRKAPHAT